MWNLVYSKYAIKDAKQLAAVGINDKTHELLDSLAIDSFHNPSSYEKLVVDLHGAY
ncbi:hypothetical protein FERRO_00500 [Ferrovum sp. JA12]|jgi:Txe/YoeB family toxin of Txe-Axe toxin-antitoxin module|uniref:hypothetical protein n=1 Tax=Ferrovum sp. JA12 TaxID=1356299 RepID=UPI00071584C8|nr:hypothetical protein [Ferrovum sp. JA12]KRH78989.1 hypothetical protein FERRO_00500 [Ferrovum sp. JA12]